MKKVNKRDLYLKSKKILHEICCKETSMPEELQDTNVYYQSRHSKKGVTNKL